ncbi:MAG: hypothetical protein WC292_00905 [Clostridia bacterium]
MPVKTKAFVNFYAAIGALEKFVELDSQAQAIASRQNITVRFNVKDGPDGLLIFSDGKVAVIPNDKRKTDIHLYIASPSQFNDVVDGKAMPLPIKGLGKTLKFMGNPSSPFSVLTNEMGAIMRTGKRLDGTEETELSTILAFYAMCAALGQVGTYDEIGKIAGARIPEGEVSLEITDKAYATLIKKDGKLSVVFKKSENPRAFMIFSTVEVAGDLINGRIDAMTCLSKGELLMKGYIPMLDNLNKVLNIVPKYLS